MSSQSKNPPNFIFLEFLDPEINTLLSGLKHEFGNSETGNDIHITVRGPYYRRIPREDIAKYERIVRDDPILIHGVDMFQNHGESVVCIRVCSDSLKKIWWKPDFPVEKFGFNPHISLHRTSDVKFAKIILDFLKKEDLKLICHEFHLVPFASKQKDFFPIKSTPRDSCFRELSNRGLVHPDILHRAANVVEEYRKGHPQK